MERLRLSATISSSKERKKKKKRAIGRYRYEVKSEELNINGVSYVTKLNLSKFVL